MKKKLLVLCIAILMSVCAVVYAQQYYNFVVRVTCSTCGYDNDEGYGNRGVTYSETSVGEAERRALGNAQHINKWVNGKRYDCKGRFSVSSRIDNN